VKLAIRRWRLAGRGEERPASADLYVDPGPRRFRNLDRVRLFGFDVPVASSRLSRLLGLALLSRDRAGGLLVPNCTSVHTFGMRFALDVLFLDEEYRVIEIRRDVEAGRIVRCPAADAVLELPSPH
jgi:uncharacterized membrane protein (UPF0127 family)